MTVDFIYLFRQIEFAHQRGRAVVLRSRVSLLGEGSWPLPTSWTLLRQDRACPGAEMEPRRWL